MKNIQNQLLNQLTIEAQNAKLLTHEKQKISMYHTYQCIEARKCKPFKA